MYAAATVAARACASCAYRKKRVLYWCSVQVLLLALLLVSLVSLVSLCVMTL